MKTMIWSRKSNWGIGLFALSIVFKYLNVESDFISFIQGFLTGLSLALIIVGVLENRKLKLSK